MSIEVIERAAVYAGQHHMRAWPLIDLYRVLPSPTIGLAAGGPYDDDGLAVLQIAGLRIAGGRRSGSAVAAVNLELREGGLFGNLARYSAADLGVESGYSSGAAAQLSAGRIGDASALVAPEQTGRLWWDGAELLARSGLWVRRKSWTDGTRRIRYEAGAGTVRGVAVLRSSAVATRAVLADEFGTAEFCASDWVLADPLLVKEDLTAAVVTLDMTTTSDGGPAGNGEWMLFRDHTPRPPVEPPHGGPEFPPPPLDGVYVWASIGGVVQWVPFDFDRCCCSGEPIGEIP